MMSERISFSTGVRISCLILLVLGSIQTAGCMSIHAAAEAGNVSEVKRQLWLGRSPNSNFSWHANTPLIKAAENGRIEVVRLLLEKGADVNKHNEGGETPLHYATRGGHIEAMTILLDHGADVSAKGTGCGTPLQWAARSGQTKAAELLLAHDADINQQGTSEWTALIDAASHEHAGVVRLLLSRGADPNIQGSYGRTALHEAASNNNVEIGRMLLAHGADPALEFYGRPIPAEFLGSVLQPGTDAERKANIEIVRLRWLDLKKRGGGKWSFAEWMKEPSYHEELETPELAEECFSRATFGSEMTIYDEPMLGYYSLEIFHNGFAELFKREDMWKGILHAYDFLSLKLNPKSDLRTIVRVSNDLDAFHRMYRIPSFKEQVKGREAIFLEANLQVLKRYRQYLEDYDPIALGTKGSPGFFREPISVARVALMLAKQVAPHRYAGIEPALRSVRWSKEQRVEDLKSYINLVIESLDEIVGKA